MLLEIHSIDYAAKRGEEIQRIEKDIAQTKKNKMLFQTLPFHKRRRSAAFDERRLPKSLRRSEKRKRRARNQTVKDTAQTLKAHTWYAKRFTMYRSLGTPLPLKRTQKSDKFIKCSVATRGILSDVSYTGVYTIKRGGASAAPQDAASLLGIQVGKAEVRYTPRMERIVVWSGEKEMVILTEDAEYVATELAAYAPERVSGLSIFHVIGVQSMFSAPGYTRCASVEGVRSSGCGVPWLTIRVSDKAVFVVLAREHTMEVLQKAVVCGIVPCSILETLRAGTEYFCAVYPFDFPSTQRGREFIEMVRDTEKECIEKKPLGKRPVEYGPVGVGTVPTGTPFLFSARKGTFPAGSPVVLSLHREDFGLTGEETLVGEVLRSSFCFTKGRVTGVMYAQVPPGVLETHTLFARNLRTKIFRVLEVTPVAPGSIL